MWMTCECDWINYCFSPVDELIWAVYSDLVTLNSYTLFRLRLIKFFKNNLTVPLSFLWVSLAVYQETYLFPLIMTVTWRKLLSDVLYANAVWWQLILHVSHLLKRAYKGRLLQERRSSWLRAVQKTAYMIMCKVSCAPINTMIVSGKQVPEKHLGSETMKPVLSFGALHTN